jgi:lysine-N-methylase
MEIIERQLAATRSHVRLRDCVQDFLHGLHYSDGAPIESLVPHYNHACARYYEPLMQQHPYMLENYLLNYIFRTRFPYGCDPQGNPNDPLTDYLVMCVLYATMKGLLIGIAGHYREAFAAPHVVKLVQSFAKSVEHSPTFQGSLSRNLASADGMALLLKNEE